MTLFRIQDQKTGKYYRGKSKFTRFGNFFKIDQLEKNLPWVRRKFSDRSIEIIEYKVHIGEYYKLNQDFSIENLRKKINRRESITMIKDLTE